MTWGALLAVGDQSAADAVNLHAPDQVGGCFILRDSYSAANGSVPAGISWGVHERGVYAQQQRGPQGTAPIQVGLYLSGQTLGLLQQTLGLPLRKLEQAMQATGPQLLGTSVVFWWRRDESLPWTYYDVLAGALFLYESTLPPAAAFVPALLRLDCLPYGRLDPITTDAATGTLTAWTPGSQLYRAEGGGVAPSQVPSLLTLRLPDLSTGGKAACRVRLGTRHLLPMLATDFTGIYAGVTCPTTTLSGGAAAGAVALVVASATGLTVGQRLIVGSGATQEFVIPTSFSGTTVRFASGLLYTHSGGEPLVGAIPGGVQVCPPATKATDATAANGGGAVARVTASASWQSLLAVFPNAGAAQNGRFSPLWRVRDASAVLGATQAASLGTPVVTAGGGTLTDATYTAFWVPKNGTNYGAPSGQVSATVQNLTPGGSTAVSTTILFYDRDGTSDFRHWTRVDAGAVASISQTDWNGAASPVFDFTSAASGGEIVGSINGTPLSALGGGGSINAPAIPASKLLSCRVRFKLTAVVGALSVDGHYLPLIAVKMGADAATTNAAGLYAFRQGGVTSIVLVGGPNGTQYTYGSTASLTDGTWHVLEITLDTTNAATAVTTALDGIPLAGGIAVPATPLVPQLVFIQGGSAGGSLYIGEVLWADQPIGNSLSVASGSSITFGISHAAGEGSGFGDLFLQQSGDQGWYKVPSVGNVSSYTLSQWPPPGGILQAYPMITPVAPVLFRVGVGILGRNASAVSFGRPFPALLSNSEWEALMAPPVDAPPIVRAQGQAQDQWFLILQCQAQNGGTPTVDADAVALHPADEDGITAFLPAGTTPPAGGIWEVDTRHDGRVRCVVRDSAGTVIAEPQVVGQLLLGPGDATVVPVVEVADANGYPTADAINTKFALQLTRITPRVELGST